MEMNYFENLFFLGFYFTLRKKEKKTYKSFFYVKDFFKYIFNLKLEKKITYYVTLNVTEFSQGGESPLGNIFFKIFGTFSWYYFIKLFQIFFMSLQLSFY